MQVPSAIRTVRSVAHDDQLSVVGHLDELRTRLMVSLAVVVVAFGFCFWQNHRLLQLIDSPLAHQTQQQVRDGHGPLGATYRVQQSARDIAVQLHTVVGVLGQGQPAVRTALTGVDASLQRDVAQLSTPPHGDRPVTLGIGEPFTTTIMVSLYFALIISLPIILYELYGFIVPALSARERKAIAPLLGAVPVLFATGVAFGYFIVLPAAIRFFVNFNSGEFNVIVQASQYYSFAATVLLAMGAMFQVPVVIIGLTRMGIVTPRQLRKFRPYAIVLAALVAAILPGDAITMALETVPLYLLYEASILLARFVAPAGETAGARWAGEPAAQGGGDGAHTGAEPSVQELIDHVDPRL